LETILFVLQSKLHTWQKTVYILNLFIVFSHFLNITFFLNHYILLIGLLTTFCTAQAQKFDAPVLTNGIDEFVLSTPKQTIPFDFFTADSVWLLSDNKDYAIHSFVLTITDKGTTERFYAPKGVIKGSAQKAILSFGTPVLLKFSEVKITFNQQQMPLPYDYELIIR
jgi:hypothetical protein